MSQLDHLDAIVAHSQSDATASASSSKRPKPKTDPFQNDRFLPLALTPEQAALMLNISRFTLKVWRRKGYGPKITRIKGGIRYMTAELERWLADQMADPEFYRAELLADPRRKDRQRRMDYANSFRECMKRKRRSAA